MAAAKKTNSTKKSESEKTHQKTPRTKVATAIPVVEHPRVARAKRLGVYHLHTTPAGGVTQAVAEASEHAYEVMQRERDKKASDTTEKK